MRRNTSTGHHEAHYPVAQSLWILAAIIALLAFGDAVILSALAVPIVVMAATWWTYREAEHRAQRNDAAAASVSHLRRASTGRRDLKKLSPHAPWRGRSAA